MIAPTSDEPSGEDGIWHVSQDGTLAISVTSDVDGERLIGFHGFEWSLPASSLLADRQDSLDDAIQRFVDDVLQDQAVIAVLSRHNEVTDIWITEAPQEDLQYLQQGETLLFRYWSGTVVSSAP